MTPLTNYDWQKWRQSHKCLSRELQVAISLSCAGYSHYILVYHSAKFDCYMTGRGYKAINICHMTYRWQHHCHMQGKVSACWSTIVTSLAIITSKKMSLCCSKLIRKISHQKPCNTQIHISTEAKLSQIKVIPFLNTLKNQCKR